MLVLQIIALFGFGIIVLCRLSAWAILNFSHQLYAHRRAESLTGVENFGIVLFVVASVLVLIATR